MKLRKGLGAAETGALDLDEGVGELKTGADDLNGGIFKLVDGSGELAGGLHEGAERIPDYDKQDRDLRTEVMADPVRLDHPRPAQGAQLRHRLRSVLHPAVAVGGRDVVVYMVIAPMNRRALAAGASAWRIALAGWLPVLVIGVLQTVALMSVLHWALGLQIGPGGGGRWASCSW
ncbi:Putative membrane protein OS=Streptomyces griseomycini OX=66895 GN=FHS37_000339 PE=4 SV=1 [Streptomyces griseomycini]